MKAALSTCPFCSCGCGLYLLPGRGGLQGVAPSESHPVSQGRLCARGFFAHEAPAWGERLRTPLIRRGTDLEPATWDEALEHAADGLRELLAAGREVGVLGSARATNEESYLLARLARAGLGTPHVDSVLRSTYTPLVDGMVDVGGATAVRGALEELERCDAILVVEGDLARSHPRVAFSVMRAVKKGARLVTLGWVRTPLARLSALHLAMAPGREMETALRLAAAARTVAPKGAAVDVMVDARAWCERLAARSPGEAEWRIAQLLCEARHAGLLVAPLGLLADEARPFVQALAIFAAFAGHLGHAGSVMLPLPVLSNLRGACEMGVVPDRLPGGWPLGSAEGHARLGALWQREACAAAGADAAEMLGRVRGLVTFEDELAAAAPLGHAALEAASQLSCLVALDAFMTPTVRLAQVVLPIAAPLETDGSVTNLEGRVQEMRAGTLPPGQARPGWRVLADLGGLLGLPRSYRSVLDVRREMGEAVRGHAGGPGPPPRPTPAPDRPQADGTAVMVVDGVYDWGTDPLVSGSPTLRRETVARLKKYPGGCVEISTKDGERLGLNPGARVRFATRAGVGAAPVALRAEIQPGTVLLPFPFRERFAGLLGGRGRDEVRLSRA